jgi:anti-sigma factor RsiW
MDWDKKRGNCEGFEALLEDSIEGVLSGEEAKKLQQHLSSCGACREALEEARLSQRLLQWGEPAAEASPGFARVVMARIREAEARNEPPGIMPALVAFASRLAITATLALGVMVAYTRVAPPAENPQMATMTAEDHASLFSDPVQQASSVDDFFALSASTSHGK